MQKPMLYMEYFLDTTKGIQQTGFQKWLIGGNDFPNVPQNNPPNRNAMNIVPDWFRNLNLTSGMREMPYAAPQTEIEPPRQNPNLQKTPQQQDPPTPQSNNRIFRHNNFVSSFEDMIRRNRSGGN